MCRNLTDPALSEILGFLDETMMSESYFGKLSVKDSTFIPRLREGRVTFRVTQKAVDLVRKTRKSQIRRNPELAARRRAAAEAAEARKASKAKKLTTAFENAAAELDASP